MDTKGDILLNERKGKLMAIYTEKILNKKTGMQEDKLIDGKKVYYIRTYVKDELGNSKQITRHNKEWFGRDGLQKAKETENRLRNLPDISLDKKNRCKDDSIKKEKPQTITLSELKLKYLNSLHGKLDEDTIINITKKLKHFCEIDETKQVDTYPNKEIIKFTIEDYETWKFQMKNKTYKKATKLVPYSIKRLNEIHNEICRMIQYAIEEGYCKINFAKSSGKIGTPKEVRMSKINSPYEVIDYDEYSRLMEVSKNDLKFNTYFHLGFTRGPRPGEVRAFRCVDYIPEKKQLMVNHTLSKRNKLKDPKTAASKAPIDLDDGLNKKILTLINYLKQQKGYNENWYIFGGEKPISSHALDYNKDKYFKLANIDTHIRLHDFRHSCATWLYSMGINIAVISKILRHSSIAETLRTYTHLFNKDYLKSLEDINTFEKTRII